MLERFELVTDAPEGLDQLGLEIAIDLLAQTADANINKIGAWVKVIAPNVSVDLRACVDTSWLAHQVL